MTVIAKRLHALLTNAGVDLPVEIKIHRVRAGRHQRSAGAWSWELRDHTGHFLDIGSRWPATELLRTGLTARTASNAQWARIEVFPAEAVPA